MSVPSSPDSVSMEFKGPVPGLLGPTSGYHAVFWVQAGGGAGFTRPSREEREYYAKLRKPVPEWQCEYFEFDDMTWAEAPLTIELWRGSAKLRSLFLATRAGRRESDVCAELPELARFLQNHGLALASLPSAFRDALLSAAESAGVIQRDVALAGSRKKSGAGLAESWWRRLFDRARPPRLGAT